MGVPPAGRSRGRAIHSYACKALRSRPVSIAVPNAIALQANIPLAPINFGSKVSTSMPHRGNLSVENHHQQVLPCRGCLFFAAMPRSCQARGGFVTALAFGYYANITPLSCRGGCYFCLDTKVTKKSSHPPIGGFFAARGLCRTNHEKPCAAIFLPRFAHAPTATCKNLLCAAHRTALPVFHGFARSLPADEEDLR